MVTASVGPYESVKVGSADFGAEGETLTQVRERIAKEIAAELDRQVRALQVLHSGKPTAQTLGAVSAPVTPSPAAVAGAPAKGVVGPEMMETRRQIAMELECDTSTVRTVKKRRAANQWLKVRGYESFDQVLPSDIGALKELLSQFESVNYGTEAPHPPLSEPTFQTVSGMSGT
jgi:hypothetical protein